MKGPRKNLSSQTKVDDGKLNKQIHVSSAYAEWFIVVEKINIYFGLSELQVELYKCFFVAQFVEFSARPRGHVPVLNEDQRAAGLRQRDASKGSCRAHNGP